MIARERFNFRHTKNGMKIVHTHTVYIIKFTLDFTRQTVTASMRRQTG